MKIKITEQKNKSKRLKDFRHKEWKLVHPKHFGTKQDENIWKSIKFILKAEEGKSLVGAISGNYMAGVMFIDQLIVKSDKRDQGIGKLLIDEAENLAQKKKLHKIHLDTGVGWKAVKFYEKLGYKKEGRIDNLYEKKDFWIMTKNL